MPRGVKKENLPAKVCVVCERPFTWRKKWESCWDEVTTCSKSCNRKRRDANQRQNQKARELDPSMALAANPSTEVLDVFSEERNLEVSEVDADLPQDLLQEIRAASLGESSDNDEEKMLNDDDKLEPETEAIEDPVARKKAERKAAKKAKKAERRAQREGRGDPSVGQKPCDMCNKSVDLLIRCQTDETLQWKMVCGKCWNKASGGVVDGDSKHPHYRYGGLWKNRRAQK